MDDVGELIGADSQRRGQAVVPTRDGLRRRFLESHPVTGTATLAASFVVEQFGHRFRLRCVITHMCGTECGAEVFDGFSNWSNLALPTCGVVVALDHLEALHRSVLFELLAPMLVLGAWRDVAVGVEDRDVMPFFFKKTGGHDRAWPATSMYE